MKILLQLLLTFFSLSCIGQNGNKKSLAPAEVKLPISTIINVYVENSGSMYGYVKGITEFEQAVYSYLSDIKISDPSYIINLNYINSKILTQPNDLEDFIQKLEPSSFKIKGGDMSTTDISNILKSILKETNENTISIFISDCVFSPGVGKNADEYLTNQQIGIKNSFSLKLKEYDFAAVVYRLLSKFEGSYYNKEDQITNINAQRPYYIWLLGDKKSLKDLITKVDNSKMKGSGVINTYATFKKNNDKNYGILTSPVIGSFDRIDKTTIGHARKESEKKEFMFSIGVNYSTFLLDDNYLLNPKNYKVSDPNYTIKIVKSKTDKYTHTLKLTSKSNIISSSNIKVELLNKLPEWVDKCNDVDGKNIHVVGAMEKTYGIKNLIEGVYEAFTFTGNVYAEYNVSIK